MLLIQNYFITFIRKITLRSSSMSAFCVGLSDCPATDLLSRVVVLQIPRITRDLKQANVSRNSQATNSDRISIRSVTFASNNGKYYFKGVDI